MIYHEKVVRELTQEERSEYLVRPVAKTRFVEEGYHKAIIESVRAVVQSNPFTPSGKSEELELEFKVKEGKEEVILDHILKLTWCEDGKMYQLLEELDLLPEAGEMLDLNGLIGMSVKILVTNMIHDGEPYSKIIDIEKYYANDLVNEGR